MTKHPVSGPWMNRSTRSATSPWRARIPYLWLDAKEVKFTTTAGSCPKRRVVAYAVHHTGKARSGQTALDKRLARGAMTRPRRSGWAGIRPVRAQRLVSPRYPSPGHSSLVQDKAEDGKLAADRARSTLSPKLRRRFDDPRSDQDVVQSAPIAVPQDPDGIKHAEKTDVAPTARKQDGPAEQHPFDRNFAPKGESDIDGPSRRSDDPDLGDCFARSAAIGAHQEGDDHEQGDR